jgi:hypothetical protein
MVRVGQWPEDGRQPADLGATIVRYKIARND